jgi:WD40 repeat protein
MNNSNGNTLNQSTSALSPNRPSVNTISANIHPSSTAIPTGRFNDLLELLRAEYERSLNDNGHPNEHEAKLQALLNEFMAMQRFVRELETNYLKLKREVFIGKRDICHENSANIHPSPPNLDPELGPPTFTAPWNQDSGIFGKKLSTLPTTNVSSGNTESNDDWEITYTKDKLLDIKLIETFKTDGVVCGISFSPDGRLLAYASSKSCIIINLDTHKRTILTDVFDSDADIYMRSISFSPDGRLLASGSEDHFVRVWYVESGKIKHRLAGHSQDIYSVKFSQDGHLFSASGDKTIRVWNSLTGECKRIYSLDSSLESGFTSISLSSSGKYFATVILLFNEFRHLWINWLGFGISKVGKSNKLLKGTQMPHTAPNSQIDPIIF